MKPIGIAVPPVLSRSGMDWLRASLERAFIPETGGVVILVGNPQSFCKGIISLNVNCSRRPATRIFMHRLTFVQPEVSRFIEEKYLE